MTKITILYGDITKVETDAIVNAANSRLIQGGGVDGAIHAAAGPELYEECKTLGGCEAGEAKITKGYDLQANCVIHTVGPNRYEHGYDAQLLAKSYLSSLQLAKEHGVRSIAFPAISTGAFGYPKEEAANIAMRTVKEFIAEHPDAFDEIMFVLFDEESYGIYRDITRSSV